MHTLGIDLSKRYFDATLRGADGHQVHQQFANNAQGFAQLERWLAQALADQADQAVHACMEATNLYWEALASHLYARGYTVSVVNPARIKGFSMTQLQRNKTDKLDSEVIAAFCAQIAPRPWQPPTQAERKLRRLVRHRDALLQTRTQQQNRLADCDDDDVRASLEVVLATLTAEIEAVQQKIVRHIGQDAQLREKKRLLTSITGLGETTVHLLMAEMYDLADYESARAAAADAGVTPTHHTSGDTIRRRPKLSKLGKASVRGALFFPAMTAIRHNPVVRTLAQRLERRGKPRLVIICAAIRKLIHLAYGVLKHRTPFDPNWHSSAAPPT